MLTHFQALLQDLLSLCSTDCAVNSDLFVSTDTERTHGVASLRVDGLLASELFQHLKFDKILLGENFTLTSKNILHFATTNLCCSCQSITRFTDADIQAELADLQVAHNILRFVTACFGRRCGGCL